MKNYFYIDKAGILHGVAAEATAREFSSNDKVVAANVAVAGGYPLVQTEKGMKDITVYSLTEAYISGNATEGKRVQLDNYAEIKALYEQLM